VKLDDETALRWAAIPLAGIASIGAAASLAHAEFLAAAGWGVIATLLVLAVCYLWHRRFEQKTNDSTIAAARPKPYTSNNDEPDTAYIGPN